MRPMKTCDAIEAFGGPKKGVKAIADFLKITPAAVYQWGDTVPQLREYQLRDEFERRKPAPVMKPTPGDADDTQVSLFGTAQ